MFNKCGCTKVMPAVVHPTKCCVKHTHTNVIVPEIHPSHTTTVNHVNFNHQHYFPHTESCVEEVTNTQSFMPGPGPGMGPVGPGTGVSPAGFGPGFGPPPRPGFGPGMGMGPGYPCC